jgi:hypothetical protein
MEKLGGMEFHRGTACFFVIICGGHRPGLFGSRDQLPLSLGSYRCVAVFALAVAVFLDGTSTPLYQMAQRQPDRRCIHATEEIIDTAVLSCDVVEDGNVDRCHTFNRQPTTCQIYQRNKRKVIIFLL